MTTRWVRKAEADILGARSLAATKLPVHDLICFHCQQSAEKYLKGFAQESGITPPRTHSLEDLLALVAPQDSSLRTLLRVLTSLGRYSVDLRYPGVNTSRREALAALRHAEKVRLEIRTRLGVAP
jgi:HEPN domain-containing protein